MALFCRRSRGKIDSAASAVPTNSKYANYDLQPLQRIDDATTLNFSHLVLDGQKWNNEAVHCRESAKP